MDGVDVPLAASVREVVAAIPKPQPGWEWRQGVVDAVGAATVDVVLSGTTITGVRYLPGYTPAVGHDVWCLVAPDGVTMFATALSSGTLLLPAGTAAAPALAFVDDDDTGFYRNDFGTVGFVSNGTLICRVRPVGFQPGTDDVFDLGAATLRWDDVYATNGTIQTSDVKVKEDVESLTVTQALAALGALAQAAITFRFDDGTRKHSGFDAAQVGQALQDKSAAYIDPAVGAVEPDRADYDDETCYNEALAEYEALLAAPKGLRYAEIIPWLTVALDAAVTRGKQLQKQLVDLTARVEALEQA